MSQYDEAARLFEQSELFDADWYRRQYPDVDLSRLGPAEHYARFGLPLRRDPGPRFDARAYLADYPDVLRAQTNPLLHFLRNGMSEGRIVHPVGDRLRHGRSAPSRGTGSGGLPDLFDLRVADGGSDWVVVAWVESQAELAALEVRLAACDPSVDLVALTLADGLDTETLAPPRTERCFVLRYRRRVPASVAFLHLVNSRALTRYRGVCLIDGPPADIPDELEARGPALDAAGIVSTSWASVASEPSTSTSRTLKALLARIGRTPPTGMIEIPTGPALWIHRLLLMQLAAMSVELRTLETGANDGAPDVLRVLLGVLRLEGGMTEPTQRVMPAPSMNEPRTADTRVVKAIAFYLPQFHPIPENDRWWGAGFTEWHNVVKARPLFKHHYQPRLPADLGYYDLRLPEAREAQARLAADHGVHGFCYYYYWFNGTKLLNAPIEQMLQSGRPRQPFCVCWANENWSRNWDGQNRHVLMEQHYSVESNLALIRELIPMMKDDRYIRHLGRPVLIVYRIRIIPDWAETARRWREECRRAGVGEIHLCAVRFGLEPLEGPPEAFGLDAYVLFPPHEARRDDMRAKVEGLHPEFHGEVFSYDAVVDGDVERFNDGYPWPVHRGAMLGWDNTARRSTASRIFVGASPLRFRAWLAKIVEQEEQFNLSRESLVFVNAWNEWAEGTVLEPDQRFGRAYLEALRSVIGPLAPPRLPAPAAVQIKREVPRWHEGAATPHPGAPTVLLCAHISGHQLFGGERSFLDVLDALGKLRLNVIVTLPSGNNADYVDAVRRSSFGVYVFAYPQWVARRAPDETLTLRFADIIAAHNVAVVYANTIVLLEPVEAARRMGRVAVTHARELITFDEALCRHIGLPAQDIVRDVLARTDFVIANSRATEAVFARRERTFYVPNAVDVDALDLPNVAGKRVRFGIVSSNIPKKGVADFVEVAKACSDQGIDGEFVVVGPDTPQILSWKVDVRSGKLPSNLRFAGYRSTPREAMGELDVLLNLSSFAESFGRTVAEALAARRPVIAYEWGALSELIEHGSCGYLVGYRDIDAVVACVKTLCAAPDQIATFGERGRVRMIDQYTPGALVGRLAEAFKVVLQDVSVPCDIVARTTIVIPVYNAYAAVERCLESVVRHTPLDRVRVLVIDDGSSDPRIADLLDRYRQQCGMTMLRNDANIGYTMTVNRGIAWAGSDDVVLLNSDTLVTPDWLAGLRAAAYRANSIGTVTAMSDNAGAFSFPEKDRPNVRPSGRSHDDHAVAIVRAAFDCAPVEVPTGSGFCMLIRRALIDMIGVFDHDAFPRGYGEENDFCMRALRAGWRNVVSPWAFVFHERSASFGSERASLVEAGVSVVTRRYPDYVERVRAAFNGTDMVKLREATATACSATLRP